MDTIFSFFVNSIKSCMFSRKENSFIEWENLGLSTDLGLKPVFLMWILESALNFLSFRFLTYNRMGMIVTTLVRLWWWPMWEDGCPNPESQRGCRLNALTYIFSTLPSLSDVSWRIITCFIWRHFNPQVNAQPYELRCIVWDSCGETSYPKVMSRPVYPKHGFKSCSGLKFGLSITVVR